MSPAEIIYRKFGKPFSEHTDSELAKTYSALLESTEPVFIAFVKLKYFKTCGGIITRYQDIPNEYFSTYEENIGTISTSASRLFVSHKWQTREHPDPTGESLNKLLELTQGFDEETTGVWWDFCCLPQRNQSTGVDDRTVDQKEFFKFQLSLIPYIVLETRQIFLWDEEGKNSGWCCVENIIANTIMQDLNRLINDGKPVPIESAFLVASINHRILGNKREVHQRIFTTDIANHRLNEIMKWFEVNIPDCQGNLNPGNYYLITKELIADMFDKFKLEFTNGADKNYVSELVYVIFNRFREASRTINMTQLKGSHLNYFFLWHYIRGTYGNCVMPKFDYWF